MSRMKDASSVGKSAEALQRQEEEKALKKQAKEENRHRKGSLLSRKSRKSSDGL